MKEQEFQSFIIKRFLIILIYVVVSEYLIKLFFDYALVHAVQKWFFADMQQELSLSIGQFFGYILLLLTELIIGGIKTLLPTTWQNGFATFQNHIEGLGIQFMPEINGAHTVSGLGPGKAFLLFLILFAAIVLLISPIVIAAIWFARIVHKEVREREKEKEEMDLAYERARNLMLSDIAHDLRTPITTIVGYSRALNDGMVTSEEKRTEYLEAIENKSERMSDLITLLFDYVKLGSDGFKLNFEKVNLSELMRENAALLYSDVEEKGMELIVDIPEEACMVDADSLQISRVITNLITNAIRHNERGTEITLELREDSDDIEIIISDNGEIIAEDVAAHIFEPFAVGDKSRRTKGGSGLGLSIAKKIVDMHGWSLALFQNRKGYKKAFIINIKKA